MNRERWKLIVLVVIGAGVLAVLAWWQHTANNQRLAHERAQPMPAPTRSISIDVEEPSGIAYHPLRQTLIIVSDEGGFVETDLSFDVKDRFALPGDLEGVAVHPDTGTLFIAAERQGAIFEYDLERRCVLRRFLVHWRSHPDFARGLHWNRGIEGVTMVTLSPETYKLYAVVEAKPARLVVLSADVSPRATELARQCVTESKTEPPTETIEVEQAIDLGLAPLSDVLFEPTSRLFYITSAGSRTLTITDIEGRVQRTIRLPGKNPEGFCFLPGGDAVVVDDAGGMYVCEKPPEGMLRPAPTGGSP